MTDDIALPSNVTLTVAENKTLTIESGKTLTGATCDTLENLGTIAVNDATNLQNLLSIIDSDYHGIGGTISVVGTVTADTLAVKRNTTLSVEGSLTANNITVYSNATLSVEGTLTADTIVSFSYSTLSVESNASLVSNSSLIIYNLATFTNNGSITNHGFIEVNQESSLKTALAIGGNITKGVDFTTTEDLTVCNGTHLTIVANLTIGAGKTLTVEEGATLTIDTDYNLNGTDATSTLVIDGTVAGMDDVTTVGRYIWDATNLTWEIVLYD